MLSPYDFECGHFLAYLCVHSSVYDGSRSGDDGDGASVKRCDWQQMIKSFEYFIIAYTLHIHTITLYLELNISLT